MPARRTRAHEPSRDDRSLSVALGEHVRAAREEAGLSQRELALRSGLSQAAVSKLESGRPARLETLSRIVAALPALEPRQLLDLPASAPPPAGEAEWSWFARVVGFEADEMRVLVEPGADGGQEWTIVVRGMRPHEGSLRDRRILTRLVRAACLAAPGILLKLDLANAPARFDVAEPGARHEFRVTGSAGSERLHYACRLRAKAGGSIPSHLRPPGEIVSGDCIAFWLQLPVRRLRIGVRCDDGRSRQGRARAWLVTSVVAAGEANSWNHLHPRVPAGVVLRGGRARLDVPWPVPGACYSVTWDGEEVAPDRGATDDRGPSAPAMLVKRERARMRLGLRELAARAGISVASAWAVERGREPLIPVLRSLLGALPGISPDEALPPGVFGALQSWRAWRDRLGMEAELESVVVTLDGAGVPHCVLRTEGIRRTRPGGGELRLRHGISATRYLRRPHVLESVRGGSDAAPARVKILRDEPGPLLYELILSEDGADEACLEREIVVQRRLMLPGQHRGERDRGPDWPADAIWMLVQVPARRLLIDVAFPRGLMPARFEAVVLPRVLLPRLDGGDTASRLHPEGLRVDVDRRRRRAVLDVARPHVGFQYAVGWRSE